MKFIALLVLIGTVAFTSSLMAETVTVTVQFKGEKPDPSQVYTVPNITSKTVSLPIRTIWDYTLDLDWQEQEGRNTRGLDSIYVRLGNLHALPEAGSGVVRPITVFETTLRWVPGQKILVFDEPNYSLSIQIDPDKENK